MTEQIAPESPAKAPSLKRVLLTNTDEFALVDEDDFQRVMGHTWYMMDKGYVHCCQSIPKPFLHHFILDTWNQLDHKDMNPLNNSKENLREATTSENGANKLKSKSRVYTSKFKGVHRRRGTKKWTASIGFQGDWIYLGSFHSEARAARAYDEAAKELFGEFARTNF